LKTSIEVVVSIEIDRPPSLVWPFVASKRMAEWLDEFVAVSSRSPGAIGLGTVLDYTVEGGRSGTLEIVEWEPARRIAWDGPPLPWAGGGARPRGALVLTEIAPGRTRLTSTYHRELSGTLVLLAPYLRRWLRRRRRADALTLKGLVEGDEPSESVDRPGGAG
jgi:uncharacterized protein YndB with AHSA1/START domain